MDLIDRVQEAIGLLMGEDDKHLRPCRACGAEWHGVTLRHAANCPSLVLIDCAKEIVSMRRNQPATR